MAHNVFISFAKEDIQIANRICGSIEDSGIPCWIAPRDIPSGINFPKTIIKAIKQSTVFVMICSSHSMNSEHVTAEVLSAFNQGIPIVAFRIEDVQPTGDFEYLLGSKGWLNAFDGKLENHLEELIFSVNNLFSDETRDKQIPGRFHITKETPVRSAIKEYRNWTLYTVAALLVILTLASFGKELGRVKESNIWMPALILLVPMFIILPEALAQYGRHRRKKQMRMEGETGKLKAPEYFRTYPYEEIPEYMKEFRSDAVHVEVLKWINRSDDPLLFLSGQSGTGKTSILNAYVCPELEKQNPPVTTLVMRSFGEPLEDLNKELFKRGLIGDTPPDEDSDTQEILQQAVKNIPSGKLLIVFDQFEELMIIHDRDPLRLEVMKELLKSLNDNPITGLTTLLAFRSDYLPLLEKLELPNLTTRKNWYEVSSFTESHARKFLKNSNLNFQKKTLDKLFEQITAFEGTKGLVRPIILNMVGLIVSKSTEMLGETHTKQTENLLAQYLRHNIYKREMKDHAFHILDNMVTEVGTKEPKSIDQLKESTGISQSEIKGALNLLANSGLVRLIDSGDQIWEVAHDFIAHHMFLILRNRKRSVYDILSPFLVPVCLIVWGLMIFVLLPPYIIDANERNLFNSLHAVDGNIEVSDDHTFTVTINDVKNSELLDEVILQVNNLSSLEILKISKCAINKNTLDLISKLSSLKELNLSSNNLKDSKTLRVLTKLPFLESLDISSNQIGGDGLLDLSGLNNLKSLVLRSNQLVGKDLKFLSDLTMLENLNVSTNDIDVEGLEYIGNAETLRELRLGWNPINDEDLRFISRLNKLEYLDISYTNIKGEGLIHLTNLKCLRKMILLLPDMDEVEIIKQLANMTSLRSLLISHRTISEEGLENLRLKKPDLGISNTV